MFALPDISIILLNFGSVVLKIQAMALGMMVLFLKTVKYVAQNLQDGYVFGYIYIYIFIIILLFKLNPVFLNTNHPDLTRKHGFLLIF